MKLLQFVTAATIALIPFTTLEGKAEEELCLKNDGAYETKFKIYNLSNSEQYSIGPFDNPDTKCVDLTEAGVPVGIDYKAQVDVEEGETGVVCQSSTTRTSSDEKWTYKATGSTYTAKCKKE